MNKVLVVGSINMDMVFTTASFPAPGETLSGQRFNTFHGGKGANQAVAARRLGAEVAMIGCVGADAFGRELIAQLCESTRPTSRPGTIRSTSGMLVAPERRISSCVMTCTAAGESASCSSRRATDVTVAPRSCSMFMSASCAGV